MPVAWFIAPYERRRYDLDPILEAVPRLTRYCAMDDFSAVIHKGGGDWGEAEIGGDCAIVKVRAPLAVLQAVGADPRFRRLPADRLDDPLASLSAAVKSQLRQLAMDAGFTGPEIAAAMPGGAVGNATLGQLLRFLTTRVRKVRWDALKNDLVLDGTQRAGPREIDDLDRTVRDEERRA